MFLELNFLQDWAQKTLDALAVQGYDVAEASERLEKCKNSYDGLHAFMKGLGELPMRPDWRYIEPVKYDEVEAEMKPSRLDCLRRDIPLEECEQKAQAAFYGSVLGCILGKPLEVNPALAELKAAGEKLGQWPIDDFITEEFLEALGRRHGSWVETTKGNIRYVATDDDINYTVLGMLNLERYGLDLNFKGMYESWLKHICMSYTFGPERVITARAALASLSGKRDEQPSDDFYFSWADEFNPGNELCGAAIRADAYGYAFPGRPDIAARLAWTDASFTHRRTGVYSTMFISAAISLMFCAKDPLDAFENALGFIPQKSRFYERTRQCLDIVRESADFYTAYDRIHHLFEEYSHCRVYQEVGTLINTMRFARDIWHGVCLQVAQGNDTDSFGCTAGSLLGAYFGMPGLDKSRLQPFNDTIQVSLASFYENSLSSLAVRMGKLPLKFANALRAE